MGNLRDQMSLKCDALFVHGLNAMLTIQIYCEEAICIVVDIS